MLLFIITVHGQINIATGGTVATCSDVFVDSGGLGGNYSSNENNQITICPDTAGNYIELDFTTFNIEGGVFDFLMLYNGTNVSGELLGAITEDAACDVTQYTSSAPGGCITIVFESDGSFNQFGWEATVSCTTTPGAAPSTPENSVCGGSGAFCADAGALEFPNTANSDCVLDAPVEVVSNSCLGSAPNPAWYFIEIGLAGNIVIDISQTTGPGGTGTGLDVDYVVWGPFPDVPSACVDFSTGNCTNDHNCTGTAVDCSYSTNPTETATIPNAQVGEFYMFLITNFDGASGFITLTQTNIGVPGAGSTDCCPFIQGTDPTTCGASDGIIEISLLAPNTSYTVTYNNPTPQSVTLTSNALGEIQITGLADGNYTNIDTSTPGCLPEDITLSSTTGATLTSLSTTSPVCSGGNAVFNLIGTPNATVTYTIDGGGATSVVLDATGSGVVTVAGVTTNTVIVLSDITISGCSTALTNTATVLVNSIPVVTNLITNSPVCTGQDAVFTITGTPNSLITYTINGGAAANITLDGSGNGVVTITGVTSNSIMLLSNISLNGCSSAISNTATVIIDPVLAVTSLVSISPVCSGQDAVFNIIGTANSTITYTINGGASATLILDGSGNGIISITGITINTTLALTTMSISGCSIVLTDNATVIITSNPTVTSLAAVSPVCSGQDAVFTISGTPNGVVIYTINGGIPSPVTLDGVGAGIVTVSGVTLDTTIVLNDITINGCNSVLTNIETVVVNIVPILAISTLTNPTTCLGTDGSIVLNTTNLPDGSYTVNYEDAATTSQTVNMVVVGNVGTISGLSAGTYNNITVTNIGCISLEDIDVVLTEPLSPTLALNSISNPTTCLGNDGSIILSTTNLPNGSYTLNYEDATATPQTVTMVVVGNIGTISGLLAGTYNNITVANNNCTSLEDVDVLIADPPLPILAINTVANPTTCDGTDGSITLTTTNLPDGTYAISYEDAASTTQTETIVVSSNVGLITGLLEGVYNNIAITFNNCTSVDNIDILLTDPLPSIIAIITITNPTICEGTDGSITLSMLNLPDGTYVINYDDAIGTPQTDTVDVVSNVGVISGLSAGTYNNITVTFLSCTSVEDIDAVLLDPLPLILAIISTNNPTTCDGTDGSITLSTANLPDGVYTVNYEDATSSPQTETIDVIGNIGVISGLSEGIFNNITVTYLSCTSVEDIDVILTDPIPSIIAVIAIGNPTMCNASDGSITLSVANLIDGIYTVNYEDVTATVQTTTISVVGNVGIITNLSAGIYNNITIISFSCSSVEDVDIALSDPIPSILAIIAANNPTTCNGSDGSIVLSTFNLPDATYIIDYENLAGVAQTATMIVVGNIGTITGLLSETYNNITVTNVGCTSIEDIDILLTDPLPPVLNDNMNMSPVCETDAIIDGVMPHDLTSNISSILGAQTGITISFYETLLNANSGVNPIINDMGYLNINPTPPVSIQTIYVRAVDDITSCISFTSFTITVMSIESNVPTPLVECDDDNDGFYFFTLNNSVTINEITNGAANVVVAFYETLEEANLGIVAAQLPNPYFNIVPYNQTVYARADLLTLNCYRIVELALNVINSPELPINDLVYNQCEDVGSTDGFVFFDLPSFEASDLLAVIIANGGDTSNYTISYYTALNASGNPDLTTLIANPNSYQNSTTPNQVIYASVTDNVTVCVAIKPINLHVNLLPVSIYTPIEECDDESANGILTFNLVNYISQISGGVTSVEVSFYENLTDAETGGGASLISDPEHFVNSVNPQSIFARVYNPSTGCYAIAIVKLHVNPNPTPLSTNAIEASLGDMQECDGNVDGSGDISEQVAAFDLTQWETQILTGDGPAVELGVSAHYYSSLSDAESGINPIMSPTNYTNISNPQTIYVSVINDGTGINPVTTGTGCYTIVSFEIYVPVPSVSISGNYVLCIDANGVPLTNVPLPILTASGGPEAAAAYNYQWALNDVLISGETNQSITVSQAGEYTVTVSGPLDFECINYASAIIIASGVPDNFSANVTTNEFSDAHQIVAEATSNIPGIVFWYSLNGEEPTINGTFNNVAPGIHLVTITDGNNCWKEEIEVLIIDYPHFFTPNGDGINDYWQIIGIEGIPISQIYIFDRFGKLLKQLDPDGIGWDGTYNGNELPSTDYWFKIIYIDRSASGIKKEFRAHFSLKR